MLKQHSRTRIGERRWRHTWLSCLAALLTSASAASAAQDPKTATPQLPPAASRQINFTKDVRPILDKSCRSCHGPEKQKSSYRLDAKADALKGGENYTPAIKPGDSAGSPLIRLVAGLVPDSLMPAKGDPLTPEQIGVLRAWIDQGANWAEEVAEVDPIKSHWSFQPVQRPPVPLANPKPKVTNPIDAFITAKLAEKKLTASREADRVTLIRRLYFVVLGMPPTPEEVATFLADKRPLAFERLVDKVLDDPRYGERWGRHWLDVIRFAESNGFETNRERPNAWRFRDYVIAAFNQDKPYDQFIREQIAGDALGVDVATGFLVGGPVDIVGSPDIVLTSQQRADQIDDMVGTTGTAFLGLTLGCARCHSHKFDPISHREYYSMSAIFAGVRHGDRTLALPKERKEQIAKLDADIKDLETRLARFIPKASVATPASGTNGNKLRPPVNAVRNEEVLAQVEAKFVRFTISAATGGEPCIDELEVWSGNRNVALATNGTKPTASGSLSGYDIHKLEHVNDGRAGNNRSWISSESGRGWVQLEFPRPERIDRIVWGRDRDGQFKDRLATNYRIEAATTTNAWKVVASSADREPFKGQVEKPAGPVYRFEDAPIAEAEQGRRWLAELEKARKERSSLSKSPSVYAGTFSQPSETFRFHRGDPMQNREAVAPGTLAVYNPLTLDPNTPEQQRRVQLANWISSPENPLTARVLVNRLWQHHFGVGLVTTPNDFGKNGARPSHPELLDWLAAELMHPGPAIENGVGKPKGPLIVQARSTQDSGTAAWSIKHIQKLILTSATWRQSSAPREEALQVDAASRLLWRFPPRRLEAEGIRDSILAVSGNLDRTVGGPSFFLHDVDRENVYHYHPKEKFGPAESRRMVYAFKVRMEQDGIFGSFDCPDGSLVMPKRSVSTTPLQALNLFNSRFILDQSETLATRLRKEAGADSAAQVQRAWQLAFNRLPDSTESKEAVAFAQTEGLPALCRAVLNSNEFLFIP
ncbi:MAG: Planctomycete cytochrome [Verrucomicrobiales bacterium]|nr:Planctomycete cytochrome [Verrucomicrobiales bacterium]